MRVVVLWLAPAWSIMATLWLFRQQIYSPQELAWTIYPVMLSVLPSLFRLGPTRTILAWVGGGLLLPFAALFGHWYGIYYVPVTLLLWLQLLIRGEDRAHPIRDQLP